MRDFYWTGDSEIIFVSSHGFELYQVSCITPLFLPQLFVYNCNLHAFRILTLFYCPYCIIDFSPISDLQIIAQRQQAKLLKNISLTVSFSLYCVSAITPGFYYRFGHYCFTIFCIVQIKDYCDTPRGVSLLMLD